MAFSPLQEILSVTQALPFGDKEAKTAALIRAEMDKKGMPIGPFDMLVTGTALANQGTLVTNNTIQFQKGLSISKPIKKGYPALPKMPEQEK